MRVAEIISNKGSAVATIPGERTVAEAAAQLAHWSIGALIVSSDGTAIEGVVSERDIVRHLDRVGAALLTRPVSSIMSMPVHTCVPDDTPDAVLAMMTELRVRHVPVVDHGQLAGVVSIGDIVKSRIEALEADRRELVQYITAR
jgi:CBS domain-containing protein